MVSVTLWAKYKDHEHPVGSTAHAGDVNVSFSSKTWQPFCSKVLPSIPTSRAVTGMRLKNPKATQG